MVIKLKSAGSFELLSNVNRYSLLNTTTGFKAVVVFNDGKKKVYSKVNDVEEVRERAEF
jgi:hypothetical protein